MDIRLSSSAAQFDEMLYKSVGTVPCFKVNETSHNSQNFSVMY